MLFFSLVFSSLCFCRFLFFGPPKVCLCAPYFFAVDFFLTLFAPVRRIVWAPRRFFEVDGCDDRLLVDAEKGYVSLGAASFVRSEYVSSFDTAFLVLVMLLLCLVLSEAANEHVSAFDTAFLVLMPLLLYLLLTLLPLPATRFPRPCPAHQPGLPVVVFPAAFQLRRQVPALRAAAPRRFLQAVRSTGEFRCGCSGAGWLAGSWETGDLAA